MSLWTFKAYPSLMDEWPLGHKLDRILEAGFDHVVGPAAQHKGLPKELRLRGMRFAGQIQVRERHEIEPALEMELEAGNGPVNCQLGVHDTTSDEAVELLGKVLEAAMQMGASVVFEVHRNTAFETPEKTDAILEAIEERGMPLPYLNFDLSHPAVVKHLVPEDFAARLLPDPRYLHDSPLLHLRPFNGQHAQLPVTSSSGGWAPEFARYLPFAESVVALFGAGGGEKWIVPEIGPVASPGYGLSCFPDVVSDAFALASEIQRMIKGLDCEKGRNQS